jgi:hypothetical protein
LHLQNLDHSEDGEAVAEWERNRKRRCPLICKIDGELYIIDFKTGQNVWPEYELQLSAYKAAYCEQNPVSSPKLAVLQIGYRRNKDGYKFTDIPDKFDLFLAAKQIWANEHGADKPSQKEYPVTLSLVEKELKQTSSPSFGSP